MSDTRIRAVSAWEVLDSRGSPTVACGVLLDGGASGRAAVPSGASRSRYEAHEVRDGGARYGGLGVRRAVENVRSIIGPGVIGLDAGDQGNLDVALRALDGTPDLSKLGGNSVLAVSVASAIAAAEANGRPLYRSLGQEGGVLPLPMVNVLSGGAHAGGAVDVQDFLVVPVGAARFAQAIEWSWRVRAAAAELAGQRGFPVSLVADEGGLGIFLPSNRAALELLTRAIERAGLVPVEEVAIAIDVAASQLATPGGYQLVTEGRLLEAHEMLDELDEWSSAFPIISIEDPLGEEDWGAWAEATRRFGSRFQLVGDDLFATNIGRLDFGIKAGVANAIIVKPNQCGTLSGAFAALSRAQEAGYATIVSARSGDTEDSWLADLAVGWHAGQIKVGSLTRSERTAKWNRLMQIEEELGSRAAFAGRAALAPRAAATRP